MSLGPGIAACHWQASTAVLCAWFGMWGPDKSARIIRCIGAPEGCADADCNHLRVNGPKRLSR